MPTHPIFGMQANTSPPNDSVVPLGNGNSLVLLVEDSCKVGQLTRFPAVGVEVVEHKSRNRVSHALEDRSPGLDRYLKQVLALLGLVLLDCEVLRVGFRKQWVNTPIGRSLFREAHGQLFAHESRLYRKKRRRSLLIPRRPARPAIALGPRRAARKSPRNRKILNSQFTATPLSNDVLTAATIRLRLSPREVNPAIDYIREDTKSRSRE